MVYEDKRLAMGKPGYKLITLVLVQRNPEWFNLKPHPTEVHSIAKANISKSENNGVDKEISTTSVYFRLKFTEIVCNLWTKLEGATSAVISHMHHSSYGPWV